MTNRREEFLAGDRPDDVAIYFSDDLLDDPGALDGHAEAVGDGRVLVVEGERGREVFGSAVGLDAMQFAQSAMERSGTIHDDLGGGSCPEGPGSDHRVRFALAFAEAENVQAGGRYAEGDVVHAYARCACGESFSDRWVAGTGES